MLDRFVQLNSFCVGRAWPYDHWNGCAQDPKCNQSMSQLDARGSDVTRTPFSCSKPSSEEHPGPPFVLHSDIRTESRQMISHVTTTAIELARPVSGARRSRSATPWLGRELREGRHVPEDEVVQGALWARWEEPEEEL